MARHRAEKTCRNKTPLRRGAASTAVAVMLLSGLGSATAFAGAPDTTPTSTVTQEASDVRTMRAVISPREGGDHNVKFENAQGVVIEHLGKSHMSSSQNGVPIASSTIYYYEATLQGSNANLAVEPVTEALDVLPKEHSAHVNALASEPGKLRFSLTVTTHHGEEDEVGVESRTVRARLHVDDNGKVTVGFVGTPGVGVRGLGTSIVSSNVPDLGVRVATTYFYYELTSDDGTKFDYDIDLNVDEYADVEGAHEVKVVTSPQSDDGTMKFHIAVSRDFPLEVEPDESEADEGDEVPDTEPAPDAPEVVTPEPEEADELAVTEEAADLTAAPADEEVVQEVTKVITLEAEAVEVVEVPADEEASDPASTFRVSSAQAPATTTDDAPADTPASIRDRAGAHTDGTAGTGSTGGGEDAVTQPDEEPLVVTPGEEYSTSDELAAPTEDGERMPMPPTNTHATDEVAGESPEASQEVAQERLADTGSNGLVTSIVAAISLALGAAVLFIRRKFLGGASA